MADYLTGLTKAGQLDKITKLLKNDPPNLAGVDRYQMTAMMYAAMDGHNEILEKLLEHNKTIDLNFADASTGMNGLMLAVVNDHVACVELLASVSDLKIRDNLCKQTILELAKSDTVVEVLKQNLKRSPTLSF